MTAPLVNPTPLLPQPPGLPELFALARFDQDLIQALIRELSQHALTINSLLVATGNLAVQVSGVASVRQLIASTATTSQMSITAKYLALQDTLGRTIQQTSGARTCDITVQGANGRDQAGAFTAGQTVHFYAIGGNAVTVQTLASLADPTVFPTLPAGFTNFCYLFSVILDGSANLPVVHVNGNYVCYDTAVQILNAGSATIATQVSFTSAVPAMADEANLVIAAVGSTAAYNLNLGVTSALGGLQVVVAVSGGVQNATYIVNNTGSIFYKNSVASQASYISLQGYFVPNGS